MILERIRELLVEQLNLDYEHLQADTRFDEIGADSIDVVELVMALEAELGVQMPRRPARAGCHAGRFGAPGGRDDVTQQGV